MIKNAMIGSKQIENLYIGKYLSWRKMFSILSLFKENQKGFWFEPTDLTTLYQDVAETIPVTGTGDPIGKVVDKSGNGVLATQGVSAARPVYYVGDDKGNINAITWSEDFTNPSWRATNALITPNAILSPIGTMAGSKLVASTTASYHRVENQTNTSTMVGARTLSVYAKAGEYSNLIITIHNYDWANNDLRVDLSTGTIIFQHSLVSAATVTAVSDGWYRVTATYTQAYQNQVDIAVMNGTNPNAAGDGTSGIYIWGAQLEAGLTASDYQHNAGHLGGIATGKDTDLVSLALDKVDDALNITIPTGGYTGTLSIGGTKGSASYGVSIPAGNFRIGGSTFPGNNITAAIIREGTLTESEELELADYFESKGVTRGFTGVTDLYYAYYNWTHLTNFPLIDSSSVTSMFNTWRGCTGLTTFPMLDTPKVETLERAWQDCTNLTSFPLLNTSSVVNLSYAWQANRGLTSFPAIDTSSAKIATYAWYNCSGLTSFPALDFSSVIGASIDGAWRGCSGLTSFPWIDTSGATWLQATWSQCKGLTSFPLINTSNVTLLASGWSGCSGLTSFPLIDTGKVYYFSNAWQGCTGLTSFPLLNTSAATTFHYSWYECTSLTSFPAINTSIVTDMTSAWGYCSALTEFPLIDTGKVTKLGSTWRNCSGLTSFPAINTISATSMFNTWNGCSGLTSFPLIDVSKADRLYYTWENCSKLTSFPLINTTNITDMESAWRSCRGLTSFPLINTLNTKIMLYTWLGCSGLTSFPLINTSNTTDLMGSWYNCTGLTSFPAIDVTAATNLKYTWYGCTSLADFPANMFDNVKTGDFTSTFFNTALTQVSIDNILISLVTSGISTGTRIFNQSGGSVPSTTGNAAIDTLRSRGWTVKVTGSY